MNTYHIEYGVYQSSNDKEIDLKAYNKMEVINKLIAYTLKNHETLCFIRSVKIKVPL